MSNNIASATGGTMFGYIIIAVQGIPLQSMMEVFIFGVIGGLAGILGKVLAEWIVRKCKNAMKIKQDENKK
ncbi:MAG: hypothetical protein RBS19_03295 [Bacteroidales bacterium]|nr:hypothetical protein [Bacteroidales bacterium]MDY0215963.1 hypothetical protein [Bacteroidales bacterium]